MLKITRKPSGGTELMINEWLWLVKDESFPVIQLSVDLEHEITEKHADAVVEFVMTPPVHEMDEAFVAQCEPVAPGKIGLELRFGSCNLSLAGLKRIDRILDQVYASPTRQFAVRALELVGQSMDAEQLSVLLDIVKKNHAVYHIQSLLLNDVLLQRHYQAQRLLGRVTSLLLLVLVLGAKPAQ